MEEIKLPFESENFKSIWGDWLLYRRQKKLKTYVPAGLKVTFSKLLRDCGNDEATGIKMIEQSMENNWRGIFPLKNNDNGQSANNGGFSNKSITRIEALKGW